MDADKMEAEFGDLFFSLINAARPIQNKPGQRIGTHEPEVYPPF